jgi:penicillin-binding protein 2
MKCHGFGPHQWNNGIYVQLHLTYLFYERSIINTKPSYAVDVWVSSKLLLEILWDDLPTGKEAENSKYKRMY